jgi:hypothetical protein
MSVRSNTKPDPSAVYTVWNPFAAELDGTVVTYQRGTRLLGSHPAVGAWPSYFALDGDPTDAASKRAALDVEPPFSDDRGAAVVSAAPVWYFALDDLTYDAGEMHRRLRKGDRLRGDDPLVLAVPASFGRSFDDHDH